MFITRARFEKLQRIILENFNPPDDSHPSWHLNPETITLAFLQELGISVSDQPDEPPEAILRASLASRGFEELSGYESLEPGATVRGVRYVQTSNLSELPRYRQPITARVTLLHIYQKADDVRLLVRLDDGSVKEWIPDGVVRDE